MEASSSELINYRWKKDGVAIPQANAAVFKINSTKKSDEGIYQAFLSSGNEIYKSDAVKLTVLKQQIPPKITKQPLSQSVVLGDSVEFEVDASGTEPLEYQWHKDGKQIAVATDVTYRIASVSQGDLGIYSVRVQNKAGKAYSLTAELSLTVLHTLTVASRDPDSGVTVTVSPADQSGQSDGTTQFTRVYSKGTEVTLSAKQSEGTNQFKQWQKNGEPVGTNPTVTVTMNNDQTLCAVYMPKPVSPKITQQPQSQSVMIGNFAMFKVEAVGTQPLDYLWYKNGKSIDDSNSPLLKLNNVTKEDETIYSVRVKNDFGKAVSKIANIDY